MATRVTGKEATAVGDVIAHGVRNALQREVLVAVGRESISCHSETYTDPKVLEKHIFPNASGRVWWKQERNYQGNPVL